MYFTQFFASNEKLDEDYWNRSLATGLNKKRYFHSLSVANTAVRMAKNFDISIEEAYVAGLLHDFARRYTDEELLEMAEFYHLECNEVEWERPFLLHGPIASKLLQEEYGLNSPEIAEAIALHTVPQAGMGKLAQIIYLADMIEPMRNPWPGLELLRQLCYKDLDRAMVRAIEESISYVVEQGMTVHPKTVEAKEYFTKRVNLL